MKFLSLPILISFLLFSNLAYAGDRLTPDDLAKLVGIILPGFTKQEVLETLGEPRKRGFSYTGQECWYYRAPEEQLIYFEEDKIVNVEYKLRRKGLRQ